MIELKTVICDWLDVTYSPDDSPVDGLADALRQALFSIPDLGPLSDSSRSQWVSPEGGSVVIQTGARFVRVSLSGGALRYLRRVDLFAGFLGVLSTHPHRITRLDAAYDLPVDAARVLCDLRRRYFQGCRLMRKLVSTRFLTSARDADGLESGTMYIGGAKGGVTARIYDKTLELLQKHGIDLGYPVTRYEVTARRGMLVTLRDAHSPSELFWHIAAPSLLVKPVGVSDWSPSDPDDTGWIVAMPDFNAYSVLKQRVERSGELLDLIAISDRVGPEGRTALFRLLTRLSDQTPADCVSLESEEKVKAG